MKEQATSDHPPSLRTKLGFGAYDFSNSGYVLIFQSFLFPILFVESARGTANPESLWAAAVAVSTIVAIIASPFVGLQADKRGRVRLFTVLIVLTAVGAAVSGYVAPAGYLALLLLFVVFNGAFELTQSLYDSFLKDLATDSRSATRISTFGWGFGYVGGAIVAVLYLLFERNGVDRAIMLLLFGSIFLLFSVPGVWFFSRTVSEPREMPHSERRVIPTPPVALRILAVYWIIAEAVGAVAYFAPLYLQRELAISTRTVGVLLLAAQVMAFPLTVLSARVVDRFGQRTAIRLCLAVWFMALVSLAVARTLTHVVGVMLLVSLVIGSTQAILRAHYAGRVSRRSPSEGFGFYAVAQKSAAVLGPAVVSLVVYVTGALRPAFVVLAALVIVAAACTRLLPDDAAHDA